MICLSLWRQMFQSFCIVTFSILFYVLIEILMIEELKMLVVASKNQTFKVWFN